MIFTIYWNDQGHGVVLCLLKKVSSCNQRGKAHRSTANCSSSLLYEFSTVITGEFPYSLNKYIAKKVLRRNFSASLQYLGWEIPCVISVLMTVSYFCKIYVYLHNTWSYMEIQNERSYLLRVCTLPLYSCHVTVHMMAENPHRRKYIWNVTKRRLGNIVGITN